MNSKEIITIIKELIHGPDKTIDENYKKLKSIIDIKKNINISLKRSKINKVKPVTSEDSTYVYDIGMSNQKHPWFFANNLLVHNSVYFTAWPTIKKEFPDTKWDIDTCVTLYDSICEELNSSFSEFMEKHFHVSKEKGSIIKAGRELVASKGLFITKKRYGLMIVDLEGERHITADSPGKLKAMGLDLRRSDTPKVVQDFLKKLLIAVLSGKNEEHAIEMIKEFKKEFTKIPPWEKGTPKRVNNLTKFTAMEDKGKANLPGHVRGAYNWNKLRELHGDNYSKPIVDGEKTIMCSLKNNPLNITKISYPIDQTHLPDWFKELPFDELGMEDTIVTKKVENLLGVLNWNLSAADIKHDSYNELFG